MAIYHRAAGSGEWQGRWITSLDSGGTVGDIRFDDAGGRFASLAATGSFAGARAAAASRARSQRLTLHRPRGRRFFADVRGGPHGALPWARHPARRRPADRGLELRQPARPGRVPPRFERPVRGPAAEPARGAAGWSSARRWPGKARRPCVCSPPAARTDPASLRAAADATLEPGSPEIKAWTYDDLQARHGAGRLGAPLAGRANSPRRSAICSRAPRAAAASPPPAAPSAR